jgi:hypothetical protein
MWMSADVVYHGPRYMRTGLQQKNVKFVAVNKDPQVFSLDRAQLQKEGMTLKPQFIAIERVRNKKLLVSDKTLMKCKSNQGQSKNLRIKHQVLLTDPLIWKLTMRNKNVGSSTISLSKREWIKS